MSTNAADTTGIAPEGADSARRRHPCMRPPVRRSELHARVADVLELHGARHPEVAASILAVRGASGLDRESFAARAGVDISVLGRAEAGEIGRDELPGALRRMVPMDR